VCGAVHRAPDSQPDKDAHTTSPANGSNGASRQSNEQEDRSDNDVRQLAAEDCEALIVQNAHLPDSGKISESAAMLM
jgi:hypothetical protein